MPPQGPQPFVIKDWANGMADSPNAGAGLILNGSIDVAQGALIPNYAPIRISAAPSQSTFTANSGTSIFTLTGSFPALQTNVAVTLSTTGSLPSGLSVNTNYYIIRLSASTFQLATCVKNCGGGFQTSFSASPITISNNGSGTLTMTTVNVGQIGATTTIATNDNFVFNSAGQLTPGIVTFYADTNGRVWFYDSYHYGTESAFSTVTDQLLLLDGNSLSSPLGLGIGSFETATVGRRYLFTFRSLFMDVCDIRSITYLCDPVGNSAWTTAWQVVTGINEGSQQMIVGDDNIMYFCNGQGVGSIQEVPGSTFAPGTSASYSFNQFALNLPQGEIAMWLEQLGQSLLVAGGTSNKIYPWDRVSPSFDLPIYCPEIGVYRLKNIGNVIYILSGIRGNVYKTYGYLVVPARKLPEYATGSGNADVQWGGIGQKSGNLTFSVYAPNNTGNSGIWMLYPDGRVVIDQQPFTGAAPVAAIGTYGDEFYTYGYNGGVDLVTTTRQTNTSYHSALYPLGNKKEKSTFSRCEVQLNKPTTDTSSTISLYYRTSLAAVWTLIQVFTTNMIDTSFSFDCGLINIENIQIQVLLSGTGNNTDRLELASVTFYP